MRLNSKAAAFVAGAVLLLAASVATAYAATAAPQQTVALQVGSEMGTGFSGNFGDEITLQPASLTSIERPNEKFHFQAYVPNIDASGTALGMQWVDFRDFEDIQLEDTNTVQPFGYRVGIDDAVILGNGDVINPAPPYLIRCEYKALDSSGTANSTSGKSFSETETVSIDKNDVTAVSFNTSGAVKHGGTWFNFLVTPDSGPGVIRVTVSKSKAKTLTYNIATQVDEASNTDVATVKLKLGSKKGTYKVTARFLGNAYGAPSKAMSKKIAAK